MRNAKSAFGVFGALLPLLYCGGLVFYFLDLSGSPQEAVDTGLGPTVIGLGAVGLLFCIPLIFKIAKLFSRPPEPGPGGGDSGFNADEAVARLSRAASVRRRRHQRIPWRRNGAARFWPQELALAAAFARP